MTEKFRLVSADENRVTKAIKYTSHYHPHNEIIIIIPNSSIVCIIVCRKEKKRPNPQGINTLSSLSTI